MKKKRYYVKNEFEYKQNKYSVAIITMFIFVIMVLNNDLIDIANTFFEHLYLFTGMYVLSFLVGITIDYALQYYKRNKPYIEGNV